jgi:hypothetical protein
MLGVVVDRKLLMRHCRVQSVAEEFLQVADRNQLVLRAFVRHLLPAPPHSSSAMRRIRLT